MNSDRNDDNPDKMMHIFFVSLILTLMIAPLLVFGPHKNEEPAKQEVKTEQNSS